MPAMRNISAQYPHRSPQNLLANPSKTLKLSAVEPKTEYRNSIIQRLHSDKQAPGIHKWVSSALLEVAGRAVFDPSGREQQCHLTLHVALALGPISPVKIEENRDDKA